jgi:hypothetical protein
MIRYRLTCQKGHEFEVWFPSSEACDKQIKKKLVACPKCESTKVTKALMAPSVVTSERKTRRRKGNREAPANVTSQPAAVSGTSQMLTGPQREILQQLKAMRDKVLAEAEYVGPRFAEEARKIHNEETPGRGIYGEATGEEIEELANEGIDIVPIPMLPDDHN